jgi:hypothetical protein
MFVVKADGRKEEFSLDKIVQTCLRAGVDRQQSEEIARKVQHNFSEGATTHLIYRFIIDEIDKLGDASVLLLRESVANLDPVSFEQYITRVLEMHGYQCRWNVNILGRFVEHQVDILAYKEKNFIVECKRHYNPHRFTGLGIVLQVEARLEDIRMGKKKGNNNFEIDEAWIITNTKFSDHAKQYAKGIGVRLTGWKYEEPYSLDRLIEDKKAYPVTILKADPNVIRQLLKRNIFTVPDLVKEQPQVDNIDILIKQSKALLGNL